MSLGVPLYASARFLPSLIQSLEAVEYPDVEILVSDRHGLDDTLARLRRHFAADPRFVFLEARDELDWVAHCNLLLWRARGRYFRWMPHDDLFPRCDLAAMVEVLAARPEVVLVYAPTRAEDLEGRHLPGRDVLLPVPGNEDPWGLEVGAQLPFGGQAQGAFKGLFRRHLVVERGLSIRPTRRLMGSERAWLAGMAMVGRFHFLESGTYVKRYHPTSTSAGWIFDARDKASRGWQVFRHSFAQVRGLRARALVCLAVVTATGADLLHGRPGVKGRIRARLETLFGHHLLPALARLGPVRGD